MQLSGQIAAMSSYMSNVNDGTAWAETASSALQDVEQMVQSARALIVEGSNGTLSESDRNEVATQIGDLVDEIKGTANTHVDAKATPEMYGRAGHDHRDSSRDRAWVASAGGLYCVARPCIVNSRANAIHA